MPQTSGAAPDGWRITKYGVVHAHGSLTVHHNGARGCNSEANGLGCRPVVVIDPEGDADIDRMAALLGDGVSPARVRTMLRELANPKPPKAAEPAHLGAVVLDASGETYTRTSLHAKRPWCRASTGNHVGWVEMDDEPLTVKSLGVSL